MILMINLCILLQNYLINYYLGEYEEIYLFVGCYLAIFENSSIRYFRLNWWHILFTILKFYYFLLIFFISTLALIFHYHYHSYFHLNYLYFIFPIPTIISHQFIITYKHLNILWQFLFLLIFNLYILIFGGYIF